MRSRQTDQLTGFQYLRARYYDAATGRFNRLDPFAGRFSDPQSLHKYLYTHADPVSGTDPSGKSWIVSLVVAFAVESKLRAMDMARAGVGYRFAIGMIGGFAAAQFLQLLTHTFKPNPPVWTLASDPPTKEDNVSLADWEENVYRVLASHVGQGGVHPVSGVYYSRAQGLQGARDIARAYVETVHEIAIDRCGVRNGNNNGMFGTGGWSNWVGNFSPWGGYYCKNWARDVYGAFNELPPADRGGWDMRPHFDVFTNGDVSMLALHSFNSATFLEKCEGSPLNPNHIQTPDVILDPWLRARPDVYDPLTHSLIWPIPRVDSSLDP